MKISVFGLGYIGATTAACLAEQGHSVCGVDVDPQRVATVNAGASPVFEPGLEELIARQRRAMRLHASTDPAAGMHSAEAILVCVGTPSNAAGQLDLGAMREAARHIGTALRESPGYRTIVIRSTVLPGTTEEVVRPIIEKHSLRKAGRDFGLAVNPEFLREGTAIPDFHHPPYIVVGASERHAADVVASLYDEVDAPVRHTSIRVAEMLKYACNAFHALKICFANEIAAVAREIDVDGAEVMELLCADTKLNISPTYLKPGFAFGGSCLPKDTRALAYQARHVDLETPLLAALGESNRSHFERGLGLIRSLGRRRVGILGIGFKPGTDDVRESPYVQLAERLLGEGFEVRIYDACLARDPDGAPVRRAAVRSPHIAALLFGDVGEVVEWADVVVLGSWRRDARQSPVKPWYGKIAIDFAPARTEPVPGYAAYMSLWSGQVSKVIPNGRGNGKARGAA
jgi:GDP-mannose 6-dehydrogenase